MAVTVHEPSPNAQSVPEAFVQDLWRGQQFDASGLSTTAGRAVRILDPGTHNTDAGPDFSNAHVRLGDMEWRGDVEIHVASRGWIDHAHDDDARYNSVVLHVALYADMWTGRLTRADGSPLPEVVLAPRLEAPVRRLLHTFHQRPDADALPCAARWSSVPDAVQSDWVDRLAQKRMQRKVDALAARDTDSLAALLQERLFAGLGYAKNDAPMSTLAAHLPAASFDGLDALPDIEALLLGVAGLLPAPGDLLDADRPTADYAMDLRRRFSRLDAQRSLPVMPRTAWTFFRLRPNNVPPLRVAQAAAWLRPDGLLRTDPIGRLRRALESDTPAQALRDCLRARPSDFWRTHYRLTKATSERDPRLGRTRADTLLTNAVAPVLLLDADRRDDAAQAQAALDVLRDLPAPRDHIVRRFRDLGTTVSSAFDAQGLHRLYRRLCTTGGCLQCAVGQWLLRRSDADLDNGRAPL